MSKTIENLKNDINNIMKDFAKNKKIFSNESQFQLELASKIKEKVMVLSLKFLQQNTHVNNFHT